MSERVEQRKDEAGGVSDIDRFADIYLNFQDRQQWLAELFASMTHAEYLGFVEYCYNKFDLAAEAKDGAELLGWGFGRLSRFRRVAPLPLRPGRPRNCAAPT